MELTFNSWGEWQTSKQVKKKQTTRRTAKTLEFVPSCSSNENRAKRRKKQQERQQPRKKHKDPPKTKTKKGGLSKVKFNFKIFSGYTCFFGLKKPKASFWKPSRNGFLLEILIPPVEESCSWTFPVSSLSAPSLDRVIAWSWKKTSRSPCSGRFFLGYGGGGIGGLKAKDILGYCVWFVSDLVFFDVFLCLRPYTQFS